MRIKRTRTAVWLAAAAVIAAFCWQQNAMLQVSEVHVQADIAQSLRILHLSDLHGAWFGGGQARIAEQARRLEPDITVLTGDLIDARHDEQAAVSLISALTEIAPVYCITGNHEALVQQAGGDVYARLLAAVEAMDDACFLQGQTVEIAPGVTLTGADDIPFAGGTAVYPEYIAALGADGEFDILLAHRPEMFEYYAAAGFELTLSGHAHGGQIRLPLIGGLYAPGQGVLPEYTSGIYGYESGVQMHVSRGLGNSVFPVRIMNRPDMTLLTIGQ